MRAGIPVALSLLLVAGTAIAGTSHDLRAALLAMHADSSVRVHVHVRRTVAKKADAADKDKHEAKPEPVTTLAAFGLSGDAGHVRMIYSPSWAQQVRAAASRGKPFKHLQGLLEEVGAVRVHALVNEAPRLARLLRHAKLEDRRAGHYGGKPVHILTFTLPWTQPWPATHDVDSASRKLSVWVGADGLPVAVSEATDVKWTEHVSFVHMHESAKRSTTMALRDVHGRLVAVTWRHRESTSKQDVDTHVTLALASSKPSHSASAAKETSTPHAVAQSGALGRLRASLLALQPNKSFGVHVHVKRTETVHGDDDAKVQSATATAKAAMFLHADGGGRFQMTYPDKLIARMVTESATDAGKPKPLQALLSKFEPARAFAMVNAVPYLLDHLHNVTLQSQRAVHWHGKTATLLVFTVPFSHPMPSSIKKYAHYSGQLKLWLGQKGWPLAMSESIRFKLDHRFFLILPIHISMSGSGKVALRHVGDRLVIARLDERVGISRQGISRSTQTRIDAVSAKDLAQQPETVSG